MRLPRVGAALVLASVILAKPAAAAAETPPFRVRAIELRPTPADPRATGQLEYAAGLGFNAAWLPSSFAGGWTARDAPRGAFLSPAFLDTARWCRDHGIRILVCLDPVTDRDGAFVFSSRADDARIREFLRLLRREAGVHDFVVSFGDAPAELSDLSDLLRYGRCAARAHADLVRRISEGIAAGDRIWIAPAAPREETRDSGPGPCVDALAGALSGLPRSVGIVWTGPENPPASIRLADVEALRERLGQREILVRDRYSAIDAGADPLAVNLGPLRDRDPRLHEGVAVYVAAPPAPPAAARLSLLTVADYLANPAAYDADASWSHAIARMSGGNPSTADALRTQALEWRGWADGHRHRPWDPIDPRSAAKSLDDRALVAEWDWTVKRYPDRIAALDGVVDPVFREALVEAMASRLAVARAVPLAVEYLARRKAGRTDLEPLLDGLRQERARVKDRPVALRMLDRFLDDATIPLP